ncbi:unnamed protein product [Ectocarpus fasciculatus]
MHGRKKSDLPQTKEEKDAVRAKISNYKKVVGAIRHKRASGQMDAEYKQLLGKLLRLHPDYYSMWNFRKEAVLAELSRIGDAHSGQDGGDGGDKVAEESSSGTLSPSAQEQEQEKKKIYKEELALSVDCIKRNPKSYPAWHHHKWALERGLDLLGGRSALAGDLALCATFLELDGRNFHCWAHRMWVAERMGLSAREEFDFTTDKIKQNFSNYSAFHFRSKVLPRMVEEAGHDRWQLLSDELDLTHDAMFTEPADQSVWWYHHFLLTWADDGADSCDSERYENVLRAEAATLGELIEVEGRCKWAEVALLLVSQRLANALDPRPQPPPRSQGDETNNAGGGVTTTAAAGDGSSKEAAEVRESCRGMAARLSELDPMHGRFYEFVEKGGAVMGGEMERGSACEADR